MYIINITTSQLILTLNMLAAERVTWGVYNMRMTHLHIHIFLITTHVVHAISDNITSFSDKLKF